MEIPVRSSPEKDNARLDSPEQQKAAKPGEQVSIIGGFREGNDIYIGDIDPLTQIIFYAHEAGEYMIKLNTSFADPSQNSDGFELIDINELLDPKTTIDLTESEQKTLASALHGDLKNKRIPFGGDIQSVSEKLVAKITGNCLTQHQMKVHPVTQEFLHEKFKHKRLEGNVDRVETDKKHRNHEFGPIVMQTYAGQLLENTLKEYGVMERKNHLVMFGMSGAYQRGLNSLSRYFKNRTNPPSNYDMHKDEIEADAENLRRINASLDKKRKEESKRTEEEFLNIKWEQDESYKSRSLWYRLTHFSETPEDRLERKRKFIKEELKERGYEE